METINKSMGKLDRHTKHNWSKKDLKVKYLPNGSNFGDIYKRSTHTLFDHLKTQQSNEHLAKTTFDGMITGAPYESQSKARKEQHDTLSRLNPSLAYDDSTSLLIKGNKRGMKMGDDKKMKSINYVLNSDQKIAYLNNRQVKYVRTNTINSNGTGGKAYKIKKSLNPFMKNFSYNTQSKLRDAESKRPKTSAINHTRDKYDPITRFRLNTTSAPQNHPKSQTISAFTHIGRIYAPNFSKEYQRTISDNENAFRRPKGMCSEMLNGAVKNNFIATPFGSRS